MIIPTYRGTPGLERYPEHEQFAVWRTVHQQLLRDDYAYACQHHAYVTEVARTSRLLPLASLPLALGIIGGVAAKILRWPPAYGVAGIGFGVLCLVAAVWYVCRRAFRQQTFMNQYVALVLRQRTAA